MSHTLDNSIHDPLLLRRGTPRSQVDWDRLVNLDESGLLIDNMELMLISQLMITRPQLTDGLIMLIQDGSMSMTMSITSVMVSLEREENILTLPARRLEVRRPDRVVPVSRPDELAVVAENVRCRLTRAVLFTCGVCVPGEGSDEEIAFLDVRGSGDGDVQPGRS